MPRTQNAMNPAVANINIFFNELERSARSALDFRRPCFKPLWNQSAVSFFFFFFVRPGSACNYKTNVIFRENGFKAVLKKWCFSEKKMFGIYIKMAFFRVSFIFFSSLD